MPTATDIIETLIDQIAAEVEGERDYSIAYRAGKAIDILKSAWQSQQWGQTFDGNRTVQSWWGADPDVPFRYWVPERNLEALQIRIAKLSGRADKLKCSAIILSLTGADKWETHKPEHGEKYQVRYVQVELQGVAPSMNGWHFAATLRHEGDMNILATVPGHVDPLPIKYRTVGPTCDHCGFNRNRKDTYVLRHDDGRYVQVGRQCIKDFTGHADPHSAALMAQYLMDAASACEDALDDDYLGGGCGAARVWDLVDVLKLTHCIIKINGWVPVSAGEYGKLPTKEIVFSLLVKPDADAPTPGPADESAALLAIEWANGLNDITSDYLWNLHVIAESGRVHRKSLGLACSMLQAHNRELAQREERQLAAVSEWFGVIDERIILSLTVINVKVTEGMYGATTLVMFADAAGNRAKWWASGCVDDAWEIGKTYTVKATVKKHETYREVNETVLGRVAVYEEKPPKALRKSRKVVAPAPDPVDVAMDAYCQIHGVRVEGGQFMEVQPMVAG